MKKILITGASGFLANSLILHLLSKGYIVHTLSRKRIENEKIRSYIWDIDSKKIEIEAFEGIDALIHLAGENIGDKSWTDSRKKAIIDSRVKSTELIHDVLTKNKIPLKCYIGASASGYYGNRGDAPLDENASSGTNFLAETCIKWENAHHLIAPFADRHIIIRIPVVLDSKQGALPKMLMTLPFALNYFGNGMQFMPWVHIKDLLSIFTFFVENEKTQGIYNVNHPQVLNNKEFTTTIAQLKKPLSPLLPIPSFMLKIIMGESASLVLDGQLVNSQKLINAGYKFQFENLKTALQDIFNKK
jgi:uncharacterized protein (TIGR01777 family)